MQGGVICQGRSYTIKHTERLTNRNNAADETFCKAIKEKGPRCC